VDEPGLGQDVDDAVKLAHGLRLGRIVDDDLEVLALFDALEATRHELDFGESLGHRLQAYVMREADGDGGEGVQAL